MLDENADLSNECNLQVFLGLILLKKLSKIY